MLSSRVMHLDMSKVTRNMRLLNRTIMPARVRMGLTVAGTKFMTDTVIGLPNATPIRRPGYSAGSGRKAGELRASGALFVDKVKKGTTVKHGETATGMFQPNEYGGTPILPGNHEACIVFNAPYAAIQHESFPSKTEPTAGRYFMSTKLYTHGVQYIGIVARAIKL